MAGQSALVPDLPVREVLAFLQGWNDSVCLLPTGVGVVACRQHRIGLPGGVSDNAPLTKALETPSEGMTGLVQWTDCAYVAHQLLYDVGEH